MNIHITDGLELCHVRQINDSYLFRIIVGPEQEHMWQQYAVVDHTDQMPPEFPGIEYLEVRREADLPDQRYVAAVMIRPPPGFAELELAYRHLTQAWQTAVSEDFSLDSRQTVISAFLRALNRTEEYHQKVASAPVFDDTPEGATDMFDYIHQAIQDAPHDSDPQ